MGGFRSLSVGGPFSRKVEVLAFKLTYDGDFVLRRESIQLDGVSDRLSFCVEVLRLEVRGAHI